MNAAAAFEKKGRSSDVESVRLGITRTGTRLLVNACFHKSRQLLCRVRIENVVVCVRHIFRAHVCNFHIFTGPRVKIPPFCPAPFSNKCAKKESRRARFKWATRKTTSVLFTLNDYSRKMLLVYDAS